MTARTLGTNLLLAVLFASGAALAQQPDRNVATLVDLEGTVSVGGAPAAKNQRVPVDTRLVTSAGARVVIKYDKGCEFRLEENKRFMVRESGDCCTLSDSVESTTSPNALKEFVAKLTNLEGTVLVSQGDAMAAGAKDQRVRSDTRVVTTAASKVTINYDNGCDVRLNENQRFTVRERGGCCALIAAVESIGPAVAVAGGSGGISGLGILGVVGVGTAVAIGVGRTGGTNVSPN